MRLFKINRIKANSVVGLQSWTKNYWAFVSEQQSVLLFSLPTENSTISIEDDKSYLIILVIY